jgi:2-oxoglutarate dehydrogenase E2 component (dihydrolipoamide succinyltransferase)
MIVKIKVPSPGESISEVEIASWLVEDGDYVEKDQEVAEVESDKATLPLIAEEAGTIQLMASEGDTLKVGQVACSIDTSAKVPEGKKTSPKKAEPGQTVEKESNRSKQEDAALPGNKGQTGEMAQVEKKDREEPSGKGVIESEYPEARVSPVAAKMMEEQRLSVDDIIQGLKRISKKEVRMVLESGREKAIHGPASEASRDENRQKMSPLRRKLAERLVSVKNETAMLTTFNECDMSEIIRLRKKYQSSFLERHGIKLGFMSFFVRAITEAVRVFPNINSRIEEEEMVTPEYCDIGIAVQTDKGLMVPVIRNAESMSLAAIETAILDLAGKARAARISLDEMKGGTFTITNGGVFGSMLSTPLLNPPQSAILGMHNIQERPVAIDGQVVVRPMMYIALSYDHRIIDGRDSVSFLVKVKELIENPVHLLFGGVDPEKLLLEL